MKPFSSDEDKSFKLFSQQEIEELNKRSGSIARYGGNKENLYGDSHIVNVGVQINGTPFFSNTCIQLKLTQKLNADHEFILTADPDEFGESDSYILQNSRQYLGSRISFTFRQWGKAASVWTGVITSVSSQKKDGVKKIIIKGKSPAYLMDNGLHCRSFEDKTFEEIIKEVTQDYPQNLVSFDVNPNFKDKLKYIAQYNQTDLQFLKNLAQRYGEYLFYTGEIFSFSAWGSRIVELTEGEDIYDFELKMETGPQKFSYTAYDPKQASDYTIHSESQAVQQSENPFQQSAVNSSETLFTAIPTAHYDQSLLHKNQVDIEESVLRQRKKQQNLVFIEATTNNPEVRIGDIAKMNAYMPGNTTFKTGKIPIESYRITEIVHEFSDGEGYTNTFVGVPKDLTVPTYYNEQDTPKAQIQHATVTDNKDPLRMGRVRVQFIWQKPNNQQTPWIQIIQPHSGTDKGTYFNPEIGETVVCAFQGGNAEAPIVLGTAYNGGEIAAYYTEGNDIKVLQTRSGTKIVFNDAEGQGSILMEDPSGNKMFMDGEGNISVNAPKNMDFTVGNDFTINVGNNLSTRVGNDNELEVAQAHTHTSFSYNQRVYENKQVTVNGNLSETTSTSTYKIIGGDFWVQSAGISTIVGAIDAKINKG
ncbi:type VI secretion system Vgr family protein [Apibacter sp. HY039]|uniref:type VI secretion system Vgr family protein n=1 Tax=Apibacter sp. HY039 TaxID=2501476 RepID=UPI000FEBDF5D|nr:phage baseplate assembly protein V [Apibacter sp. HY039]